jgi:iron complex transport system ATP-binding protein
MIAASLEIHQLSFTARNGRTLLHELSFHVEPGEILAIAGPNGAGKSTLLKLIAGLMLPSAGRALLDGQDIRRMTSAERARRIAMVGQSDLPDERLRVGEYVALGTIASGGGRHTVDQAIAAAGLDELADRKIGGLSGGEVQRAKIARAICQRPGLLVLDEPTNHLDPRARGDLLGLAATLSITVVATLHELTLIDGFADTVLVIEEGEIVAFGPPGQALSSAIVRRVFDVDHHRLAHPTEDRLLPVLDIDLPITS